LRPYFIVDVFTTHRSVQDACPLLASITSGSMTRAQCLSIADGALALGLNSALQKYLAIIARMLQAKQDQIDAVVAASPVSPLVPHTGFGFSITDAFNTTDYLAFRDLGENGLWPAYNYVVSVWMGTHN
jgi:hypothetical protein